MAIQIFLSLLLSCLIWAVASALLRFAFDWFTPLFRQESREKALKWGLWFALAPFLWGYFASPSQALLPHTLLHTQRLVRSACDEIKAYPNLSEEQIYKIAAKHRKLDIYKTSGSIRNTGERVTLHEFGVYEDGAMVWSRRVETQDQETRLGERTLSLSFKQASSMHRSFCTVTFRNERDAPAVEHSTWSSF